MAILAYAGRALGLDAPGNEGTIPVSVTFPTAFLGGMLALLSPCSGAILPAFFAYSFRSPGKLLSMTYVFYLGLAVVFVPFGFASSLLVPFLTGAGGVVYVAGGLLLAALGAASLLGFDPFARLSSARGAGHAAGVRNETLRVFTYGVVFGTATGSCTAPLVGAIATIALGTGLGSLQAMLLFLVFALGIVAPLFVLAAVFERYRIAERGWLRPRVVRVLGRETTVHQVVTGAILVALGVVFMTTRGTLDLVKVYDRVGASDAYAAWTERIGEFFAAVPGPVAFLAAALALALAGWGLVRFARPRGGPR